MSAAIQTNEGYLLQPGNRAHATRRAGVRPGRGRHFRSMDFLRSAAQLRQPIPALKYPVSPLFPVRADPTVFAPCGRSSAAAVPLPAATPLTTAPTVQTITDEPPRWDAGGGNLPYHLQFAR